MCTKRLDFDQAGGSHAQREKFLSVGDGMPTRQDNFPTAAGHACCGGRSDHPCGRWDQRRWNGLPKAAPPVVIVVVVQRRRRQCDHCLHHLICRGSTFTEGLEVGSIKLDVYMAVDSIGALVQDGEFDGYS